MATTPLDRLLFLQGGRCFFCRQPLPKAEASIEHLQAVANGGTNHDDNCVACCKALNRALGSMSLKAKIEVVLNQKGTIRCPDPKAHAGAPPPGSPKPVAHPPKAKAATGKRDALALVTANLKQRGSSRPRTEKTLLTTIATFLGHQKLADSATDVVARLVSQGKIMITDGKVSYAL